MLADLLRPLGGDPAGDAHALVAAFGSLGAVFAAGESATARVLAPGARAPALLAAARAAMLHVLREPALNPVVIAHSRALIDYLTLDMAHLPTERMRVLFLNSKNRLLGDEVMGEGTVSGVRFYPREIIRRALELGATALILVHNHPSGDAQPSSEDLAATRLLVRAAAPLGIVLHDHVIVAHGQWTSFRGLGLV